MRRIACIAKPATSRIRRRTSPGSRPKGAVAPTIRICRRRMRRFLPLMALLLAGCAQQSGGMPAASPPDAQSVAFSTYLTARFAAGEHDLPQAARYYSRALANDPAKSKAIKGKNRRILLLHIRIVGATAPFGRDPGDILRRILEVAGFAMHAILRIDLKLGTGAFLDYFINARRTVALRRLCILGQIDRNGNGRIAQLKVYRLIFFMI